MGVKRKEDGSAVEADVAPAEDDGIELKPKMSLLNGVTVIVGSIIGSGIFISPTGVLENTGSVNASLIVWVLSGVFSMVGAYCYAELGCMISKSGADYAYVMETFGPFIAFMRLWVECMIVRPCSQAIVALTFSLYVLKPMYTDCDPPEESTRLLAACCIDKPGGFQKVILVLGWDYTLKKSCVNWYDTTTNKWDIAPEMTKFRKSADLSIIKDHFLFAVGGVSSSSGSRSVEMLDLTSQSPIWVPTVDMLVSRRYLGVAELDDCIYAVGGDDGGAALNSVEVFDISIQKWRMVSNMTTKRSCMGMGVLNNRIYAIGGRNDSGHLNSVECYDPSLDKWTAVTIMSVNRSRVSVGVLDGVIYAIGGRNESGVLKSVESYKPSDGVWTSVADMHKCRKRAGVVAFGGLLYVMGCKSFEIYNPATNSWKIKSVNSNTVGRMYAAIVLNRPPHFRSN